MKKPVALSAASLLITRPRHQSHELWRLVKEEGWGAHLVPVIEITAPHESTALEQVMARLATADIALFVSVNAVEMGCAWLEERGVVWPKRLQVGAVGNGTAKRLTARGIKVDLVPPARFDSEQLLALPALNDLSGKRIVIFRGCGGREHLGETLQARGATVHYAEVYERHKPTATLADLLPQAERQQIGIIVVTSNEGLQNLYEMAGEPLRPWLTHCALVVFSERAVTLARSLGFCAPIEVASPASDLAIVVSIKKIKGVTAVTESSFEEECMSENLAAVPLAAVATSPEREEESNTAVPEKNVLPTPTVTTSPPPPSGSGSSMAVVAAMISAVAAGGVFYLWKEVSTVQNTVATRSNSGVDQGQLDTLQKTLDQTFQANITKSAAELTTVITETRGALEKQINAASSEAKQAVVTVQSSVDQLQGRVDKNRSETEMAITTAKGDLQGAIDKNHAEITTQLATTKGDLQGEFSQNIAATNSDIASNKAGIAEVKGSFGELRQQLSDRVQTIESAHTTLTAHVQEAKADLNRAISRNQITWTAAEVEHILQIANEQIQLEKSVVKAVTALRSADQRLQSTPDPAFIKVRDAIQKEIAALNGVVVPDIHGTALTLSRLADGVPALSTAPTVNPVVVSAPINSSTPSGEASPVTDAANTSLQALKGFATAAVNGLSNFVSVKQDGKFATALLPPNQAYYLQQNLQLKLEAARLALLQQDNETFHTVLDAALAWTQQYFNPDADSTRQFTAELTRLKTLNVSPALPDISESLKVLREVQPNLS